MSLFKKKRPLSKSIKKEHKYSEMDMVEGTGREYENCVE
jgi:hypothetical protein